MAINLLLYLYHAFLIEDVFENNVGLLVWEQKEKAIIRVNTKRGKKNFFYFLIKIPNTKFTTQCTT